ncbi:MAG TPA: hypothetical protein DIC19_02055 [Erysipelotrichaceae bacterium]|nr:hypothetical protein [Erysipelotrichaceae bacterium]
MRKFKALFIVMLKNTFNLLDGRTKRSKLNKFMGLFLVVAFMPTLFSLYMLAKEGLFMLLPIQQEGLVLSLLFIALSSVTFFMSIFLVPAVYYFSKDSETLLALPLKPEEIVLSKFCLSVVYEYLTTFLLAIPVLVAYVQVMNPDVFFYVKVLIILLLSPVVPLAFGAIIIMVIMAFVPFFKNRDLFNYASGFLALAFAIGINVVVGGTASLSQEKLLQMLTEGNNSLLAIFRFMFPNLPFAIQSLVDGSWLSFILFLVITALVVLVFLYISKIVYFIGIIGVNETAAGRKQLNLKAYQKETSTKGALMSYFLKEMRLMIRTPIYLLNNIATAFILPIIFLVSIGGNVGGEEELSTFIKSIDWTNPDLLLMVSFAGLALGLMMSTLNLITPTALSREGSNIFFMKYIPMSYVKQIQAKILSGLVVSFFGILFSLIAAVVILRMHPIVIILILVMSIQGMIFMNYLGMIVDLIRPKLVWEQEAAAVKQNLNAAFTMIPAFALSFLPFLLMKYLPNNWFTVVTIFVLFSFVNWMLIRLTTRMSITKLHELEV